jgi:hypothetical protein
MTAVEAWPPTAEALLPLLGLSHAAQVVAAPGELLRPGRERDEADTLVAHTAWLIADPDRGVVVRSAGRVIQVAAVAGDERFTPFARVRWVDLPEDIEAVAAVVAPLCRSAEQLITHRGKERGRISVSPAQPSRAHAPGTPARLPCDRGRRRRRST